jgi:tetratricopeptide (TPR) repeat protein
MAFDPRKPLCFVIMPFGTKKDWISGLEINFNAIYDRGIRPGIEAAGLEPIRADEEQTGGIIHKPMFERLILCDFAVADLTTANANVFYEIGVRHAVRPATTLTIFAEKHLPPFDVNYLRSVPYAMGENNSFGEAEGQKLAEVIARRLRELKDLQVRGEVKDSPIFQLLPDYPVPQIKHLKTDIFREQAEYAADTKAALANARDARDKEAVHAVEVSLGSDLGAVEAGILVDLFLSYRAVQDWQAMVTLYGRLPAELKRMVMLREQLGFALNRLGRRDEALRALEGVLTERGVNSETCGLIGRIYKDKWAEAKSSGKAILAAGELDRAIAMYRKGFEADIRDYYPGVNAVTLLEIKGDADALAQQQALLPVVRFAVEQKVSTTADYWTLATQLELAVLADDRPAAAKSLSATLAAVREAWEPLTTANNLKIIRDARSERGVDAAWIDELIGELNKAGGAST